MRILIAEDDLTSRLVMEAAMRQCGYDVIAARDGNQAWAELQKDERPKIAILDWMMPGMDGIEVCKRVRTLPQTVPLYIIMVTAMGLIEDIVTGLKGGADDYITKPFEWEELYARLQVGQRVIELQDSLAARVEELQAALSHIKTLQGFLPICAHCHRIRKDDQQSWQQLESYIREHSEAQFSHTICPDCMHKHYQDLVPPGPKREGGRSQGQG